MNSGKSASAFVSGVQQGYGFVEDAYASKENRANKQRTADQNAKLKEEAIYKAQSESRALKEIEAGIYPGGSDERAAKMQEEINRLTKQQQTNNGSTLKSIINDVVVVDNTVGREEQLVSAVAKFKSNPEIVKSLGIQNMETLDVLRPGVPKDRKWISELLSRNGISPQSEGLDMSKPESQAQWDEYVDKLIGVYPALKADGTYIDMDGLSKATGASNLLSPSQKERVKGYEQKLDEALGGLRRKKGIEGRIEDTIDALKDPEDRRKPVETVSQDVIDEPTPKKVVSTDVEAYNQAREQGVGYKGDVYTRKNEAGSSAYGKYQVIDSTNARISERLGMTPEEGRTPEGQEKVYAELKREGTEQLKGWGEAVTPANLYAVHQLGAGRAKRYFEGTLTDKDIKVMNDNLPKDKQSSNSKIVVSTWSKLYNEGGGPESVEKVGKAYMAESGQVKPIGTDRMKHLYALAGMNYPVKEPKQTADMTNYEFLKENGYSDDEAFKATYGSKTSSSLSRGGKTLRDANDAKARGDLEQYGILMDMARKQANKGTSSTFDYKTALADNKKLDGLEDLTASQQGTYDANLEIIEGYETTASTESSRERLKTGKEAFNLVQKHVGKDKLDKAGENDLRSAENIYSESKKGSKVLERENKIIERMQGKQLAANDIATFLNDFNDPSKNLKNLQQGIIDNMSNWAGKLADPETVQWLDKITGGNWENQVKASVEADTRLGYLQAQFIKAISGTAASDAERQQLVKIMQSSDWNDEDRLLQSLEQFHGNVVRENKSARDQIQFSPYSAYEASQMTEIGKPSIDRTGMPTRTVGGETRYWDGNTWII